MNLPIRNWNKEVHKLLSSIAISDAGSVAAFDFDNTLVKNDFGESVMNQIIEDGLVHISESDFIVHFSDPIEAANIWKNKQDPPKLTEYIWSKYLNIFNEDGLETAYRWSSFIFSGQSAIDLKNYSKSVWKKHISKSEPKYVKPYPEMIDLISYLKHYNWKIYIVTASPTPVIQAVSNFFGVDENNVIGMEQKQINGILSMDIEEPFPCMNGKVVALKNRNIQPYITFGDSINDMSLLGYSNKLSVLIDKGEPSLAMECSKKGFLIQKAFA